jgi:drug/metabolite transporter (DMT)-like permease
VSDERVMPSETIARPAARALGLTAVAMLAFAANSILCRLALAQGLVDPASFTLVRIASGAFALWLILALKRQVRSVHGSWAGALALFVYASAFSFAYTALPAGTGALLLFGAVQVTMVATALVRGARLTLPQWFGFALALTGLAALLSPGAAAPPITGAALMIASGAAWGAYSLLGRGAVDPLASTAGNFMRALPLAVVAMAAAMMLGPKVEAMGLVYAVMSGALASGLGYWIWYAALRGLSPVQGASVQLSVPVLTALVGTIALGEAVTTRLSLCSITILGGIALVIVARPNTRHCSSVATAEDAKRT